MCYQVQCGYGLQISTPVCALLHLYCHHSILDQERGFSSRLVKGPKDKRDNCLFLYQGSRVYLLAH